MYTLLDALTAISFGQERKKSGNSQEELNVDPLSANSATDGDEGPEEAWRWINIIIGLRSSNPQRTIRKRGYVMWDLARLVAWGFFDQNWHSIPCEEPVDSEQLVRRIAYVYNSFNAKRAIWDRDGRG